MLNSLVLRALSGVMAINMAAMPISTYADGDVVNTRFYGTYETHLPSGGKIIIDSSGCKLEKFYRGNSSYTYAYVNTSYTKVYTISLESKKFTADFNSSQVTWVNSKGEKKDPPTESLLVIGTVDERDEEYAPPRRYIVANGFSYWKDLK